jgi:hypothetical protein
MIVCSGYAKDTPKSQNRALFAENDSPLQGIPFPNMTPNRELCNNSGFERIEPTQSP